jgi:hypothetical protein
MVWMSAFAVARLFVFVTRFKLISNGKDQHLIPRRYPAIFGHIAELAARKDQLPAPVLRFAPQQPMVRKQLEGSSNADHPRTRELRIVVCEKIEKPLEIGEHTSRSRVASEDSYVRFLCEKHRHDSQRQPSR